MLKIVSVCEDCLFPDPVQQYLVFLTVFKVMVHV